MRDRTILVYWRWAWIGILPGVYLSAVSDNPSFVMCAMMVYFGAGLCAATTSASMSLPAATIGAFTWLGMMLLMISKYLPLGEMWEAKGEMAVWAAVYVLGGAAAVLFLGLSFDPVYSRRSTPTSATPLSDSKAIVDQAQALEPSRK